MCCSFSQTLVRQLECSFGCWHAAQLVYLGSLLPRQLSVVTSHPAATPPGVLQRRAGGGSGRRRSSHLHFHAARWMRNATCNTRLAALRMCPVLVAYVPALLFPLPSYSLLDFMLHPQPAGQAPQLALLMIQCKAHSQLHATQLLSQQQHVAPHPQERLRQLLRPTAIHHDALASRHVSVATVSSPFARMSAPTI